MIRTLSMAGLLFCTIAAQPSCKRTPPPEEHAAKEVGSAESDDGGTRVKECNRLTEAISAKQEVLRQSQPKDAQGMHALSGKLSKTAAEIAKIQLTDTKLKQLQQRYVKLLGELAEVAKITAQAMESVDIDKIEEVKSRRKKLDAADSKLVKEINSYCEP